MTILFVTGAFPIISETFIVNQIHDFLTKGHKVYIYSIHDNKTNFVSNQLINDLENNVIYHKKNGSKLKRYVYFFKFLKSLPLKNQLLFLKNPYNYYSSPVNLIANEVDVIHCHFGPNALWFYENVIKIHNFPKAKYVCTFHGYDMSPHQITKNRELYQPIFNNFNLFTYNTPYLGDLIKKCNSHLPIFENPVGVNIDFLNRYYKPHENNLSDPYFTILFVGRLIKLKGVLLLPTIIKKIIEYIPNIRLNIVGDGECRNELEQEIERLNISDYIVLKSNQNQDEVFRLMNESDVFLFPGLEEEETLRAETQGLVVQEAQFFGLPVIVSDAGGIKYGLIDKETGLVVQKNDLEGFVNAIDYLFRNKAKYQSMSRKAREFVIKNYDINYLNERLLEMYKRI